MSRITGDERDILLISIALILGILVAFEPVRHNGFVNFDDDAYITENPHVKGGISVDSVIRAFTRPHFYMWHPLTSISHMLDCELFGLNPVAHHFVSLLLHVANALLLFWVLRIMTGAVWRSAFVAALFALHPLGVESVAWAAERKNLLSTFFWILTIAAYARYARRPGLGAYLLVIAGFCLGLLSKPMVVTLPFVLLLLDYWPLERVRFVGDAAGKSAKKARHQKSMKLRKTSVRHLLLEKMPLFVLAAVVSLITFAVQKSGHIVVQTGRLPLVIRLSNAAVSYVVYIGKIFYPARLAMYYPYQSLNLLFVLACFGVLATITAVVLYMGLRHQYLVTGWLWYLGTLVPVIGLVQVGSQAMADRYTYVPGIGIFIMIAWAAAELSGKLPYRKVVLGIASAIIFVTLAVCTRMQVCYWRDSYIMFEHTLAVTENNRIIHKAYGDFLRKEKRFPKALKQYDEALHISPNFHRARENKGRTLIDMRQFDKAIALFTEMLAANPDRPEVHDHIAVAYARKGALDNAVEHFKRALAARPDWPAVHNDLGTVYRLQGRYDLAVYHYQQALQLNPDYEAAKESLAVLLKLRQEPEGAESRMRE
jgi:Tfp pilus assembly protein PilF